jgi:hypothetical protein
VVALWLAQPPPTALARPELLGQLIAARLAVELVLGLVVALASATISRAIRS